MPAETTDRWAPTGRTRMRDPKSGAVVDVYMSIDVAVFARICAGLGKAGFEIRAADCAEDGDFAPPASLQPLDEPQPCDDCGATDDDQHDRWCANAHPEGDPDER